MNLPAQIVDRRHTAIATPDSVRQKTVHPVDQETLPARHGTNRAPLVEPQFPERRANPGEIRVAIASHNLRSVAHAISYNRLAGGTDEALEFQVLRGLGDDLAHALAGAGFRARSYCPVGDLVAGMAYLVRRLLENTANESFLAEQARGAPLDSLLAAP